MKRTAFICGNQPCQGYIHCAHLIPGLRVAKGKVLEEGRPDYLVLWLAC